MTGAETGKFKIAGILGGMGPEATVDLMRKIIAHTVAEDDCDHVPCLVDQNPQVPSRVRCLLESGRESPGPHMAAMAVRLERGGADFLCIACNTAHHWHADVAAAVSIPVLHMPKIAAAKVAEVPGASGGKIGILCTPGTHLAGVYEKPCASVGLAPVYADDVYEKELMGVIEAIKAGRTGSETRKKFADVVRHMEDRGVDALILGCTELGIIGAETGLPVVDAADALAIAVVQRAGARLR